VPASIFKYGSTLIREILYPEFYNKKATLDIVIPLPIPLATPPPTNINLGAKLFLYKFSIFLSYIKLFNFNKLKLNKKSFQISLDSLSPSF
jgi:hypothetical protein